MRIRVQHTTCADGGVAAQIEYARLKTQSKTASTAIPLIVSSRLYSTYENFGIFHKMIYYPYVQPGGVGRIHMVEYITLYSCFFLNM